MKRWLCLIVLFAVTGCADMNVPNPFATSSSDVGDVFYDEFPDVPIPRDMSVDRARTLVSVTPEGVKMGLLTTEGRYDMASLSTAMIHNLNGQGWALRAVLNGKRMMQIYEKDNRTMAVYYYPQMTSVAMEIWMALRLPDGMLPSGGSMGYGSSMSGIGNTTTSPVPAYGTGGGTPLTQ